MKSKGYSPKTEQQWKELVLFYLSKRETSRPNLKRYLWRKVREYRIDDSEREILERWFESILDYCERLKLIDHERYSEMLTREYTRRGKGKRYITSKLQQKGLKEESLKLSVDPDAELERAMELADKTLRRSAFQKIEDRFAKRTKLLRTLISNGFEMSVAKRVVETKIV